MTLGRFLLFLVLLMALVLAPGAKPTLAQNSFDTSYAAGVQAYEDQQFDRAYAIWEPLAKDNHASAQYSLGKLYETGGGSIRRDYSQAAQWYREAAAQGVTAAQNNLALMYAEGRGVPRDVKRATELWQAAAEGGHAMAQYNVGLAYYRGDGTGRDEAEALRWFRQAADGGLPAAQFLMGQMNRLGLATDKDPGLALAWYERAAAQNYPDAEEQAARLRSQGTLAKAILPDAGNSRAALVASADQPAKAAVDAAVDANGDPAVPAPPETDPGAKPESNAEAQLKSRLLVPPALPETRGALPETGDALASAGEASKAEPEFFEKPIETAAGPITSSAAQPVPGAQPPRLPVPVPTAKPKAPQVALTKPAGDSNTEPKIQPQLKPDNEPATLSNFGGYGLWLASARSKDRAAELLRAIRADHTAILGDVTLGILAADLGQAGTFYRVIVSQRPDRQSAEGLCRRLQTQDPRFFCKVFAASGQIGASANQSRAGKLNGKSNDQFPKPERKDQSAIQGKPTGFWVLD